MGRKNIFSLPTGRVTGRYGERRPGHRHSGVDYGLPMGSPIHAAGQGLVEFAGPKGAYGNTVMIKHPDGTETLYGHESKINVKPGQMVNVGDIIGLVGSTGRSTGPHLHFEARQGGQAIDPMSLINKTVGDIVNAVTNQQQSKQQYLGNTPPPTVGDITPQTPMLDSIISHVMQSAPQAPTPQLQELFSSMFGVRPPNGGLM